MLTDRQRQILQLEKEGLSQREIARRLGIAKSTVWGAIRAGRRWLDLSPGIQGALSSTGVSVDRAHSGWIRQETESGFASVYFQLPQEQQDDILSRIREAMEGIKPAAPVAPPDTCDSDLLTLYPVADLHSGMMSWKDESGENYDTRKAISRLQDWIWKAIAASPASSIGVVLFNGDTLHADDSQNVTPRSKHALDMDKRFFRTIDMTVQGIAAAVDLALQKHGQVALVIKPGNHDPHSYLALLFAMRERYREEPRVTVDESPSEFWIHQHGRVLLAAHHGDKAKPERLVMFLADEHARMWGATQYRYVWTGHLHHHKSAEIGGVIWEQSRAVAAKDAYAASHAYSSRAELQGITYHRDRGEVSRVRFSA